jgi:riboflavin synthase alpha subunit
MKQLLRLLTLFAFVSVLPGARAADVSGTWKGAFDLHGNNMPVTLNLKIDGSVVTGTVEGLPTTPAEIRDGALAGDTVTFWVNTDYQGQTHKLVYKGKVAADQITFDFGTEDGTWSSPLTVKKSLPGALPAPAPADVGGDWKGSFDANGTPTELKFRLRSTGNAVTGTVERAGAPPMEIHEGKVDGDKVTFWVTTDYEGQTYTVVYKGKVAADQIDFEFGTADQSWGATMTAKKSTDAAPAVTQAPATPQK